MLRILERPPKTKNSSIRESNVLHEVHLNSNLQLLRFQQQLNLNFLLSPSLKCSRVNIFVTLAYMHKNDDDDDYNYY